MALGNNMNLKQHIAVPPSDKAQKEDSKKNEGEIKVTAVSGENNIAEVNTVPQFLEPIIAQNLSITFTPSRRKTTRRILITVTGEFTIQNIVSLNERIPAVAENYDYIDFNLKSILQIDLASIQLIYTIKSLFARQGKFISIDAEFSKEDNELLESCGFKELFSKPRLSA